MCSVGDALSPAEIVDATGCVFRTGNFTGRRLVSLVPSLTEALFALGLGGQVTGVTRFCEEPARQLTAIPRVGGTKDPDVAVIRALCPDLVIASSEENREVDVAALREAGVSVFVTHFPTVRSAIYGIASLARLLRADAGCSWLDAAVTEIAAATRRTGRPIRYFCPIWRRPYMAARRDTYMSDLLALAGGSNALPERETAHYFPVSFEKLVDAAPEIILLPDEPFRFQQRHVADFSALLAIPAVRNGRVHLVDGKALTWYGPRTATAIQYFAGLFDTARVQGTGEAPR